MQIWHTDVPNNTYLVSASHFVGQAEAYLEYESYSTVLEDPNL